ncbi:hypothetical protein KX935_04120 [Streptobacillus moniliformis]|uniref:hypothetical protein n=1 Tax=Streptobacillus moniliformis TaxID=34105 RepID=UPI0007EEBFAE|nr:hypothetical protein [Streptobacillus moniliformis]QXW66387.1 hypothetical protein KX935_04120 [Streptobacillus moniliformis]
MIKYFSYIFLLFTVISCTSLDEYLKEKNLITQNDHIKYVEIKDKKEEVKKEENEKTEVKIKEVVEEVKTKVEEKKQEVKKTQVITPAKTEKEIKAGIIKSNHLVKDMKNKDEEPKKAVEPVVEVISSKTKETVINFDETDLQIVKFIAEQVVENEEQIKKKTIESIQKLESKGYRYSAREFLAKAYDNIKKTNVNSYILAAARVMNSIERGVK